MTESRNPRPEGNSVTESADAPLQEFVDNGCDLVELVKSNARRHPKKKDRISAHGGLPEPLNRAVPAEAAQDFVKAATALKRIPVSDADLSSLYRFGDGGLSPLTGP